MRNKFKDEDIKKVMDSLQSDIPAELDILINDKIREEIRSPGSFFSRLNPLLKWSPALAAGIFLIFLSSTHTTRDVLEERPMKEIRIEYELKDKNIKILWVKKEGFTLKRRIK